MGQDKIICLNRSVLDFMEQNMGPGSEVIEFGSGWSSAWIAQRCERFISFETTMKWIRLVGEELSRLPVKNWELKFVSCRFFSFVREVDAILRSRRFRAHVVLVDCRDDMRHSAALIGWQYLRPGGVLILDDAQRDVHRNTVDWLDDRSLGACQELTWQDGDIEAAQDRIAMAWEKPQETM